MAGLCFLPPNAREIDMLATAAASEPGIQMMLFLKRSANHHEHEHQGSGTWALWNSRYHPLASSLNQDYFDVRHHTILIASQFTVVRRWVDEGTAIFLDDDASTGTPLIMSPSASEFFAVRGKGE